MGILRNIPGHMSKCYAIPLVRCSANTFVTRHESVTLKRFGEHVHEADLCQVGSEDSSVLGVPGDDSIWHSRS